MKTFTYSLLLTLSSSFSLAQVVNIPDAKFKDYLINEPTININGDSEIQLSEAISFTGTLECFGLGVNSFEGIESFVNITGLQFSNGNLASLDLSNNKQLKHLACWHNNLSTLDLSSNTKLENVQCPSNNMTSLILGDNPVLSFLWCDVNKLTSLDLSKNIGLERLECGDNELTSIQLPKSNNLNELQLVRNQLTTLDVRDCLGLQNLLVSENKLTSLDLSKNIDLKTLWVPENKFKSINIKNGSNDNIVVFDVTNNPELICIQVDNVNYSVANWKDVDATANYSTNCDGFLSLDNSYLKSIKVYPNPSNDNVYFSEKTNIELYSSLGQKLKSENQIKSLDISNLSKGIYLIVIKDNSGKEIQKTKIIKE